MKLVRKITGCIILAEIYWDRIHRGRLQLFLFFLCPFSKCLFDEAIIKWLMHAMRHAARQLPYCLSICIMQLNLNAFETNSTDFWIDSLYPIIAAIKHAASFDTLPWIDGCVLCSFTLDTLLVKHAQQSNAVQFRWAGLPVDGIPPQIRSRAHCSESIGNS